MKAYIRVDPLIDEHKSDYTPAQLGTFLKVLALASRGKYRGRFRSRRALVGLLPAAYVRQLPHLFAEGDLIEQPDGEVYVDGYDEWQEGDLTVRERMARLRNRQRNNDRNVNRNGTVTGPQPRRNADRNQPRNAAVTQPSPTVNAIDRESLSGDSHTDVGTDTDVDSQGVQRPGRALTTRAPARGSGAADAPVRTNGEDREARIARARVKLADPAASPALRELAITELNRLGASLEPDEPLDFGGDGA